MEIPFRGPDMGVAHQRLDSLEAIPVIQEGGGNGIPHHMDRSYFYSDLGTGNSGMKYVSKSTEKGGSTGF
jgi:hypothetical protein